MKRFPLEEAVAQQVTNPKSKTGYPGIRFKDGKYEVWKRVAGKRIYIGRFVELEEAVEAQVTTVPV